MAPKWTNDREVKKIIKLYQKGDLNKEEALSKINAYSELLEASSKIQGGINTDVQTSGIKTDVEGITDAALAGRAKAHQIHPDLQIRDFGIGRPPRNIGDGASINQMDLLNKSAYDHALKENTRDLLVKPQLRHQFNMGLMNNIADGLLFFGL